MFQPGFHPKIRRQIQYRVRSGKLAHDDSTDNSADFFSRCAACSRGVAGKNFGAGNQPGVPVAFDHGGHAGAGPVRSRHAHYFGIIGVLAIAHYWYSLLELRHDDELGVAGAGELGGESMGATHGNTFGSTDRADILGRTVHLPHREGGTSFDPLRARRL